MAVQRFTLFRADDGLTVSVGLHDLTVTPQGNGYVVQTPPTGGGISLTHQPQHSLELAKNSTGTRPPQDLPIYASSSVISFLVPGGTPAFPFTVEGILGVLPTLELHHHPQAWSAEPFEDPQGDGGERRPDGAAAERQRRSALRGATAATAVPPSGSAVPDDPAADPDAGAAALTGQPVPTDLVPSHVDVPSRLSILLGGGAFRFLLAVRAVEHNGRVELWNSRLAVRTDTEVTPPLELRSLVTVNAVTSFPLSTLPQPPHGIPGTADAVWVQEIKDADLTTIPSGSSALDIATQSRPNPLTMEHLHVTPAGGSTQLSGRFATGPTASYQHRVVLGRDEKARISVRGHLFPFGHRAVLSSTTVRRPDSGVNGSPAGLTTTSVLIVREATVSYSDGDPAGRAWPWRSVEITNRTSPPGDLGRTGGITFLMVNGSPFRSVCVAVDRAGHSVTFELPLLFVPEGTSHATAVDVWAKLNPEFRTFDLRGQTVGVTPPPNSATPEGDPTGDATSIHTTTVALSSATSALINPGTDNARFRPTVTSFVGTIPVLEGLGSAGPRTISYAQRYLSKGFAAGADGLGNAGQLLLELAGPAVDLGKNTAGLVAPAFRITGISRSLGAVAGDIGTIADNHFRPEQWLADSLGDLTLLGVFKLTDLLPKNLNLDMARAPKQVTEIIDGLRSHVTTWNTDLLGPGESVGVGNAELSATPGKHLHLFLRVEATADPLTGTVRVKAHTEITDAVLGLGLGGGPLITLPIPRLAFDSVDGGAPTTDIDVGIVTFHGPLSFVNALADLLKNLPLGQRQQAPAALRNGTTGAIGSVAETPPLGPSIEVLGDKVRASLNLAVPDLAFGMFSISDLVFLSRFELALGGGPPTLELNFATFENPFTVAVSGLGGGGFLMLKMSTNGLDFLAGGLDFGAQIRVNLGVAKGSVSITGGVLFEIAGSEVSLSGYLRVRGELEVLSLISVCVQLTVLVEYVISSGKIEGEAELLFKVKVWLFSKTVKTTFRKQFVGSNADPTFAELMAPAGPGGERGWDTYCLAFA